jgi:hypothetical protein
MRIARWLFGEAKLKEWCVNDLLQRQARRERILPKYRRDPPGKADIDPGLATHHQ